MGHGAARTTHAYTAPDFPPYSGQLHAVTHSSRRQYKSSQALRKTAGGLQVGGLQVGERAEVCKDSASVGRRAPAIGSVVLGGVVVLARLPRLGVEAAERHQQRQGQQHAVGERPRLGRKQLFPRMLEEGHLGRGRSEWSGTCARDRCRDARRAATGLGVAELHGVTEACGWPWRPGEAGTFPRWVVGFRGAAAASLRARGKGDRAQTAGCGG